MVRVSCQNGDGGGSWVGELRRLSEYGSVACLVERPTRETWAELYSDAVLHMLRVVFPDLPVVDEFLRFRLCQTD